MKFSDVLTESENIEKLADEIIAGGPRVEEFFYKSLEKIYQNLVKSGKASNVARP